MITLPERDQDRHATAAPAHTAAEAAFVLLWAERKRSVTVQWMPEGLGCRFEIIRVVDGAMLGMVHVTSSGRLWLERGGPDE